MREIVKYKEFFDSCIKAPIEEVIRDYYECNFEKTTQDSVDFWKSKWNVTENERMGETQLLDREKEWNTELVEARKSLSNALQESLDREAVLRKDIRKLKQDMYEGDYVFIWHKGMYDGDVKIVHEKELDDIITVSNGYEEEDRNLIRMLKSGKTWEEYDWDRSVTHTIIAI